MKKQKLKEKAKRIGQMDMNVDMKELSWQRQVLSVIGAAFGVVLFIYMAIDTKAASAAKPLRFDVTTQAVYNDESKIKKLCIENYSYYTLHGSYALFPAFNSEGSVISCEKNSSDKRIRQAGIKLIRNICVMDHEYMSVVKYRKQEIIPLYKDDKPKKCTV